MLGECQEECGKCRAVDWSLVFPPTSSTRVRGV